MKWLRWHEGRQGTGYRKMPLLPLWILNFDVWLLVVQRGGQIDLHIDPAPKGFEHHRINILLKRAEIGGNLWTYDTTSGPAIYRSKTITYFRPDKPHRVSKVIKGSRWIISIGWIQKKRRSID